MKQLRQKPYLILLLLQLFLSCNEKSTKISQADIDAINLKKGKLVLCGPPEEKFGVTEFDFSCSPKVKSDFNLAIALLHSFEYDEAEKVFAKIIDAEPGCAMAYWGVAMSNYHPLWTPPAESELKKGAKAIAMAKAINPKSKRESEYIDAIAELYTNWEKVDYHTRSVGFEKGMEKVYADYPDDKEAAIFYALSLDAAADPADKTFANQKKAGTILNSIYPNQPNHPGVVHYIIHSYDYPELAMMALPAARKYASIAPSSAHAQHMPSHIFTRLGLWDECIQSNQLSVSSAKCYAESASIKGHWDEELHGMDYLIYAYLQKSAVDSAKQQLDYLKTIRQVYPENFKVAYAFAAIPARYALENRLWKDAAGLDVYPAEFPWAKFPWQNAITHFAKLLGDVHTGKMDSAKYELNKLQSLHDTLTAQKDSYKTNQVQIQILSSKAWILFKEGKNKNALDSMYAAAAMEDATEKHPVTPAEVLPARELLGDMLMEMNQPAKALEAYQEDLKKHPKRFNGLYGAGLAAEKSGDMKNAKIFYQELSDICEINSTRPELLRARTFIKKNN